MKDGGARSPQYACICTMQFRYAETVSEGYKEYFIRSPCLCHGNHREDVPERTVRDDVPCMVFRSWLDYLLRKPLEIIQVGSLVLITDYARIPWPQLRYSTAET